MAGCREGDRSRAGVRTRRTRAARCGTRRSADQPAEERRRRTARDANWKATFNSPAGVAALLDTAAIIECLDLVVSCDTAIAHLAGALGKPTWIALKHVPDWRWNLSGPTTPWYPTARLFRQRQRWHWGPVFEEMAATLRERRT